MDETYINNYGLLVNTISVKCINNNGTHENVKYVKQKNGKIL